MRTFIPFSGMELNTPETSASPGALAMATNLIQKDGVLRPALPPRVDHAFTSTPDRAYLHDGRYIEYHKTSKTVTYNGITLLSNVSLIDVSSVGNILVISASDSLHYILYDANKKEYRHLGNSLPDIDIKFTQNLHYMKYSADISDSDVVDTFAASTDVSEWMHLKTDAFNIQRGKWMGMVNSYSYYDISLSVNALMMGRKFHLSVINNTARVSVYAELWSDNTCIATTNASDNTVIITSEMSNFKVRICALAEQSDGGLHPPITVAGSFTIEVGMDGLPADGYTKKYFLYNKDNFDKAVSVINRVKADALEKGRLIHPFFIRYALRLYDGSYAKVSSPTLMIPNTRAPEVVCYHEGNKRKVMSHAYAAEMLYQIKSDMPQEWADVIQGIDIFITPPVYAHKESVEFDASKLKYEYHNSMLSKGYGTAYLEGCHVEGVFDMVSLKTAYDASTRIEPDALFSIGAKTKEEFRKSMEAAIDFHRIASIDFKDIKQEGSSTSIPIEEGSLKSIDALPVLKETALHYSTYAGMSLFSYNSRLHCFGGSVVLPKPTLPSLMSCEVLDPMATTTVAVYLHTSEGERCVVHKGSDFSDVLWFYYPDSRAYKVEIYRENDEKTHTTLLLTRHPLMAGAFWLSNDLSKPATWVDVESIPTIANNDTVKATQSLYLSSALNPFVFPSASVTTVGNGHIVALSCAARPLSTGQFGEYPLYAFTSEGIWALTLSQVGTYIARQPISREICGDFKTICQLDNSVVFSTGRGLMHIQGSDVTCISTSLHSRGVFDPITHKHLSLLCDFYAAGLEMSRYPTFLDFIEHAEVTYDYIGRRLILTSPKEIIAYTLSLDTGMWSAIQLPAKMTGNINSYPEAKMLGEDGKVYNFSQSSIDVTDPGDWGAEIPVSFVTRPFYLGSTVGMKCIRALLLDGDTVSGKMCCALYGSRDGKNWVDIALRGSHLVNHMAGCGYRWFRLAMIGKMSPLSAITGMAIDYRNKYGDRLK